MLPGIIIHKFGERPHVLWSISYGNKNFAAH